MAATLERIAETSGVSRFTVSRVIIDEPDASARKLEPRSGVLPAPEGVTLADRDDLAPARGADQLPTTVRQRPDISGAGDRGLLIDVIDDPLVTSRRVYRFHPARGARFVRRGLEAHERKAHSATE